MSVILFILGILVAAAGIVTIVLGIPINEFNLGNTLIVSGTIAFSTGLILLGLAAAVDQLAQVVKALRPRAGTRPTQPQAADQPMPAVVRAGPMPVAAAPPPLPQAAAPTQPPGKAPMPAPPRNPIFARGRGEDRAGEPAEAATEASYSAIERLRSSLAPSDRKTPETASSQDASHAPTIPAPPATAGPALGTNGASPAGGGTPEAAKRKPPLDFLFRSKARDREGEPFDDVWPKRAARQTEEAREPGRPAASQAPKPPAAEMPAGEEARSAILKSGVVDGMAYTLYVDGSIEAQLPQGTVRFGSIAELRSHIENNS